MLFQGIMNLFKDIAYSLVGWTAAMGWSHRHRSGILIVRVDEIGDYLLWRPYLKTILSSERFQTEAATLCGNISWKGLYDMFDATPTVETLWIDKARFKKDLVYRFMFLRKVWQRGYQVVINPTFSRDKRYDDAIVKASGAPLRYGMKGNPENLRWYDQGYDKHLYNQLMISSPDVMFELYRNAAFAAFITGGAPEDIPFKLDTSRCTDTKFDLPNKYFIIFTGSRSPKRLWPIEYFNEVASFLHTQSGWTAVLCGGPSDKPRSEAFIKDYASPCLDLTGQTDLPALMAVIAGASCVLTVDTGSVHMAAALGTKVFAVFNGSQYGRFAPYPPAVSTAVYCLYPKYIRSELNDPAQVRFKYLYKVDIPYDSVNPEDMMEIIRDKKPWEDA